MFAKIFYWRLIRGSSTGQAGRLQTECCSSVLSRSHCLDYFRSEHKLEYNSYFIIVPLVIYLCCASSHPFVNGDLLKTGWFQSYQGYSTPFCPSPVESSLLLVVVFVFFVFPQHYLVYMLAGCWVLVHNLQDVVRRGAVSVHSPVSALAGLPGQRPAAVQHCKISHTEQNTDNVQIYISMLSS